MLRTSAAVPRTSLRGPPRRPPRSLQLRVLLSWPLLSALFFTCLGGASLSTCTVPGVVDELRLMSDGTRVLGTVDHVQFTRVTINKKPVYQYDYSFELDGEHYLASDYSYRSVGPANGRMYVEVARGRPETSRLVGHRTTMLPLSGGLLLLAFMLVAGFGFAKALQTSVRRLRLLTHGLEGRALLIERRQLPVKGSTNNGVRHELEFAFEDHRGRTQSVCITTQSPDHFLDEEEEPILFDPFDPTRVAFLDELPGRPRIDAYGELVDSAPGRLFWRLSWLCLCALVLGAGVVLGLA